MCENGFHVISRFRNDVVLYYPTLEKKTGKRGHPKWFDGRIDFANLDLTPVQGIRGEQRKAIRIEGIRKSSQKVCFLSHLVSDGRKNRQVATLFLYRRFHGWTRGAGLLQNQVPVGILL